ncbi:MAG: hypothetical protein IJW99_10990 [Clostridia bacterium]|nr:hypothetical protein [Clostridia bacterium]
MFVSQKLKLHRSRASELRELSHHFFLVNAHVFFLLIFYFWQKKKAHGFFFSMCLGWLIFCPDRVQIPELWGNSDFISPFLYLDISLQSQDHRPCRWLAQAPLGHVTG